VEITKKERTHLDVKYKLDTIVSWHFA